MNRKYFLLIVAVVILSLFLVSASSCGGPDKLEKEDAGIVDPDESEPVKEEEKEEVKEEDEKTEDEEKASEIFRVGDTVIKEKYNITLTSARWFDSDGSAGPDEGKKWLAIGYDIENVSAQEFSVSRLINFKLYNSKGDSSDIHIFADTNTQDYWIGEGESIAGEIVFIVEEGDSNWEFVFNPDAFAFPNPGLGKASFEISIDDINQ